MKEFVFIWSIKNVSYSWHRIGEEILSPLFTAGSIQNSSWKLELYPRGQIDSDYIGLSLKRGEDNASTNLSINFEFSCISADDKVLHCHAFLEDDMSFTKNGSGFGHPRFMRRHEVFITKKALYLAGDVLTLRCRMWKDEGIGNECGIAYGRTVLQVQRISFVQNINFESSEDNIVNIYSNCRTKLFIINISYYKDLIAIAINPASVGSIKFSILKLSFKEKGTRNISQHVSSWLGKPAQETWRLPFVNKTLDTEMRDSGKKNVELQCKFVYSTGEETKEIENGDAYSSRIHELESKNIISRGNIENCARISEEMWKLYEEHILCNLELKTKTNSFFVHKVVLCSRSPVFLSMLTGDLKEKSSECVEIEDIVDKILQKLLLFLYTDEFEENLEWNEVIGLHYASDKYQIERLKALCCNYFLNNIDVDNVCELLMMADRRNDGDFKRKIEDFILENDEKIFSSLKWMEFVDEEPHLPVKTMMLKYDKERVSVDSVEKYDAKLSRLPNFEEDFAAAYLNETVSDIIVKTRDATFKAHRSVLSASSPIIREKLAKDPTDTLEISDLDDDTVSRVLPFLYEDSLDTVEWDTAVKLYHAAQLYQIQRLKIQCSCYLLEIIDTSNASQLLLLADEHADAQLKSKVEEYIFLHDDEIFASDDWASFCKTNVHLACETMRLKYRKCSDVFQL